jgi:putative hydrolase of the HAD superfamily
MGLSAVTFDCWSTLIAEVDPGEAHARRVRAVAALGGVAPERARRALDVAWTRHIQLWTEGVSSGAPEMARWSLEALDGRAEAGRVEDLTRALSEASLGAEVVALEGSRRTLEVLAEAGLRRALICDTGFSPGRVVRRLLERTGLLEHLEVLVFSDEAGVPKPHPRVFERALQGLSVPSSDAVHVGDLRRTDVAGGRGVGMGTVRLRQHHDDLSEHPEADWLADSHEALLAHLLARSRR